MPNKPNLLLISSRVPYPVIGGDRLRLYHMAKVLASKYNVHLVCLADTQFDVEKELPNDGVFSSVERILLPKWQSWLNSLIALLTRTPLQVAYYKSSPFYKAVIKKSLESEIIVSHLIRTSDVVSQIEGKDKVKILEMTDAISLNYQRSSKLNIGFKRFIFWLEIGRLQRYELAAISAFDASVLVSGVDKTYLSDLGNPTPDKVFVCSNGVDLDRFPFDYTPDGKTILFIGSMDYHPNIDAVVYFIENVFPLIRKDIPEAIFRIVGRIAEKDIAQYQLHEGVEVTGTVESVASAAQGATVGVCPVRVGAGVQNKILEYMALGMPTVTTTMGLEGLAAQPNQDLFVVDDPSAMARQIVDIMKHPKLASDFSRAGRSYVETNHAWDAQFKPLLEFIDSKITQFNIT